MSRDHVVYYNENDPFAVKWLSNLMKKGAIPDGEIDTRSIADVGADDVRGFAQCHWFAGIGGWPLALRLAGIDDDAELWTGSCPCQPFAVAGQRRGFADDRDLWPLWFRLIEERRPPIVFGEQVEVAARGVWLDRSYDDLEGIGYTVGAAVMPACSVRAPHRRERLWFGAVADADDGRRGGRSLHEFVDDRQGAGRPQDQREPSGSGSAGRRAWSGAEWIDGPDDRFRRVKPGIRLLADGSPGRMARLRAIGNAIVPQAGAEFVRAFVGTLASR